MKMTWRMGFILLLLVGLLTYLVSFFGTFVWDDIDFVTKNVYVKEFRLEKFWIENALAGRSKVSNYFRPIQETIYAGVNVVFGENAMAYHAVSILTHIAASFAVFWFLLTLTHRLEVSFLTSIVFLVHPVQTEAVSYISGLSDPLWVLFGAASLTLFLQKKGWVYIASLLTFVLAILSKETGLVILPILFILCLLFLPRKNLLRLIPFGLLSALYLFYHVIFITSENIGLIYGNNIYARSIAIRLAVFIQNFFTYLTLLIFPKDLFMERDYMVSLPLSIINPYVITFFIATIVVFTLLVFLPKEKRQLALFFLGGFYISLLPYTGIVLINGLIYEHFLYFPLVFFFGLFFFLIEKWLSTRKVMGLITIFILMLTIRSGLRQYEWIDEIRFYKQTLKYVPQSSRMINNLAMRHAALGQLEAAIDQYKRAISQSPDVPNYYHNLANAYVAKGDLLMAETNYVKAISLDHKFIFSYKPLFDLYRLTNQSDKANKIQLDYKSHFSGATLSL